MSMSVSMIHVRTGDATAPLTRPALLAHICNDVGAWGRGFVVAVSRRWPDVAAAYRHWLRASRPASPLGMTQILRLDADVWIANMIAQHGIGLGPNGTPPIRYDALRQCLTCVGGAALALRASVHLPRIGCGLAGGRWDRVEPIITDTLCARGIVVSVYDRPRAHTRPRVPGDSRATY